MIDARKRYKKKIKLIILLAVIGIGQLIFTIIGRSKLIWSQSDREGSEIVSLPQSYLLLNRYVIVATGSFPTSFMDDILGNISFTYLNTGKKYLFEYRIEGYWISHSEKSAAKSFTMLPGQYNITWFNIDDRIKYSVTTQGIFNWFAGKDSYPYTSETIALVVSLLLCVFIIGYAFIYYQKAKYDLAFYL